MMIPCPWCGNRDHSEFRYGGDASKQRPRHGTGDRQAWHDYVFVFDNPKALANPFFLLYPDWALIPMVVVATTEAA